VPKSPEERELETFLSALPSFQRKEFEHGMSSLTQGEMDEWWKQERDNPDMQMTHRREYERLLRRIPVLWREHRKRLRKEYGPFVPVMLPPNPEGRPRRDAIAEEAQRLKRSGLSYGKIAMRLNQERGPSRLLLSGETITGEQIRGLLKYRRRQPKTSPDKT